MSGLIDFSQPWLWRESKGFLETTACILTPEQSLLPRSCSIPSRGIWLHVKVRQRIEAPKTMKYRLIVIQEFFYKTITKLANGNSLYGCYGLAASIFTAGLIRDYM